jgi:hypothetical protein
MAISFADFPMGPAVSVNVVYGRVPSRGRDPIVALSAYILARSDGTTMEPSVSVPIATGANPAETPTVLPDEEPPGVF